MDKGMEVVLATRNRKKVNELKKILGVMGSADRIYTLDDFPQFEDIVEDGKTFEENAIKKAVYISKATGMSAIADDSGLEVDALGGAPGVFSARYAGENADDASNNSKLLEALKDVPDERRTARFVCCIALADSGDVMTFMGFVEGRIGRQPKGDKGFGYDPLFYPDGYDRTFAEMKEEEKNVISHRANALRELQKYLLEKRGYIKGF